MRCHSVMCFSSSIICLLIVTSHGSVASGRHAAENSGPATGRVNSTQHRRNHQLTPDLKYILNSSHHQKDLTSYDYLTYHNSDSPVRTSKSTSHIWRKQRSADVTDYANKVSSQVPTKTSYIDPSQQPVQQEPFLSTSENNKESSSHNHQNHSHDESESIDPNFYDKNSQKTEDHEGHGHTDDHNEHKGHGHKDDHNEHKGHSHKDDHNEHNGHHDGHGHDHHEHKNSTSDKHHHPYTKTTRDISGRVWLYASAAVVIISLCGLFSVAVIPIMQKWFYHTLLQFLVGLAVGSLSGDGLLHLMPHAILGGEESHDHNNHNHDSVSLESIEKTAIWRGLAAIGGVFLFFIAERLLGVLTAHRRQKKEATLSRHTKNMIPVMQREEDANNGNVGEKLAQPKKNSYDHIREKDEKETIQMLQTESTPSRKGSIQSSHEVGFHGRSSFSLEPEMSVAYRPDSESSVIVSDHHGHSHGHTHDLPHSVSAVAWMVIMGDGLHNFCDGLAIGAAFASSDADGVSTTVAVFCHELPHELGDFAMLLKTGMNVKQALFYNGLSSILCFVGMVIGVCLGNVHSATNWVFAGTAGMFLYIALVDMLPELTSGNESGTVAISTLAVQVIGICIGICVMLLIALYEHKLAIVS